MSHNIESIAWANSAPWHGLGVPVSNDLTVEEMMIASGTNWSVEKHAIYTKINGMETPVNGSSVLVRDSDLKILDIVGGDNWFFTQNAEAFEFFREFVERGDMTMETAGSLQGGKIVWILAKVKQEFEAVDGDTVESHLLFTNYHKYGCSRDIRFTPTRVVCNNTLTMALNSAANRVFKASHRVQINDEMVKETLGISRKAMDAYEERAKFLASKKFVNDDFEEFLMNVFPSLAAPKETEQKLSRNAKLAQAALTHQPGTEFAPGSWWQAFNAVTYVTDHLMGRSADNRVHSMWYGTAKDLKAKAYNLALDFANKS